MYPDTQRGKGLLSFMIGAIVSLITVAGVRILMSHGINRREMVIAATSIGLGLGVSFKPEVFGQLPLKELFQNPICMGGLAALLMNLVMPADNASRVYLSDDLEV